MHPTETNPYAPPLSPEGNVETDDSAVSLLQRAAKIYQRTGRIGMLGLLIGYLVGGIAAINSPLPLADLIGIFLGGIIYFCLFAALARVGDSLLVAPEKHYRKAAIPGTGVADRL